MELAQLRMLKTISETGSIARAAALLHCVPSNITARIKSLEAELGGPVFYRQGRGLKLSPAGEALLGYASRILGLVEEAKRVCTASAAPTGRLRIGAIESSAAGRLPPLMAKYHAAFPGVSLELSTGTWAQLIEDVLHQRLDGVIVAVEVEKPLLKRAMLYQEDLLVIASPSLGPLQGASDLEGKAIFMWPEGCPYRAAFEQWLRLHGQAFQAVSVASYGAIVGCVSAGAGVALVPRGIYEQYHRGAGWAGYAFPDLLGIDNHFYWHAQAEHHPARDAFVAMLQTEFHLQGETAP